jgi:hypothetical protein
MGENAGCTPSHTVAATNPGVDHAISIADLRLVQGAHHMKRAILVIGFLGLLVCSVQAQTVLKANIPFEFIAGETTFPAGTYEFKPSQNFAFMEVQNTETGKSALLQILTRLGTADMGPSRISFDKVGEKTILESVLPVGDDGYLFLATKEKHTHRIVKLG